MDKKEFTLSDCRSAIAACDNLIARAESQATKAYWRRVQDVWKGREREAEIRSLRGSEPCRQNWLRHGQDEYKCPRCGIIWALDEDRPPCRGAL